MVTLGAGDAVIWGSDRVNVEGDEEAVQEVISEDGVERVDLQAEDVVQVVQVVQVLGHQVLEPIEASVAAGKYGYTIRYFIISRDTIHSRCDITRKINFTASLSPHLPRSLISKSLRLSPCLLLLPESTAPLPTQTQSCHEI